MDPQMEISLGQDRPWLPVPGMPGCAAKILRVDEARGEVVFLARLGAGAVFPRHVHHCRTFAYTVRGSWIYEGQHVPEQGLVYEPAGLDHEAESREEVEVFVVMVSEDGRFMSAWVTPTRKVELNIGFFKKVDALSRVAGRVGFKGR